MKTTIHIAALALAALALTCPADEQIKLAWDVNPEPFGTITYSIETAPELPAPAPPNWTEAIAGIPHQPPAVPADGIRTTIPLPTGKYSIRAFAANSLVPAIKSDPSDTLSVTAHPAKITGVLASTQPGQPVTIAWNKSTETGITYSVQSGKAVEGPFTTIATGAQTTGPTTITTTATLPGGSWFLTVVANHAATGIVSLPAAPAEIRIAPTKPKGLIKVTMQSSTDANAWKDVFVSYSEPQQREFFRLNLTPTE